MDWVVTARCIPFFAVSATVRGSEPAEAVGGSRPGDPWQPLRRRILIWACGPTRPLPSLTTAKNQGLVVEIWLSSERVGDPSPHLHLHSVVGMGAGWDEVTLSRTGARGMDGGYS